MNLFEGQGIYCTNFKCFGDGRVGIEKIKPINLLIGRNNAGKSSFLDVVVKATENSNSSEELERSLHHKGTAPKVWIASPITEHIIESAFERASHTRLIGMFDAVGGTLIWDLLNKDEFEVFIGSTAHRENIKREFNAVGSKSFARNLINQLHKLRNVRIAAERNVVPEGDSAGLQLQPDGLGATNLIQRYLNKTNLSSELIEGELLADLNKIFSPDLKFKRIVCQQHENLFWEVCLEEEGKGRILLSQSGSGLKTVILVLLCIIVLPVEYKRDISTMLFAFEELENNLHPALLRRLMAYIVDVAVTNKCPFFLTTHSSVVIDMLSKDENAQIIHVTHDGERGHVNVVKTYFESRTVLDDLDVRASDLLQANAIIWVEGPSDRTYINKRIEIWSDGELKEGTHYQCVFYGGRLLAHLSSNAPGEVDSAVSILNVNRNAILLIDSDKRAEGDSINATKERMVKEVVEASGVPWVTRGKEIENYISKNVVAAWLEKPAAELPDVPQYGNFFEYLDEVSPGDGKKYEKKKPMLVELLVPHMTKKVLQQDSDLAEHLDRVCDALRRWNSI